MGGDQYIIYEEQYHEELVERFMEQQVIVDLYGEFVMEQYNNHTAD